LGKVEGNERVGGLVGSNLGRILMSYAIVSVSGTDIYIGGLVGVNHWLIEDAYARGNVEGRDYVGKLVGLQNQVHTGTPYGIKNTYATGNVTGGGSGGLVWYSPAKVDTNN